MHNHKENMIISLHRIVFVLLFNLIITIIEFLGGIFSKSLALVSDSFHNLIDSFSLLLTFIGIKISRKRKNSKKTYGYKRGQIVIAFINSILLIIVSSYLFYEGINKIFNPTNIDTRIMVTVGLIGLFGNFFSILILRRYIDKNLNIKTGYLHLLSDTLSSIAVVTSAIFILLFDIYILDGIITVFISIYIVYEGFIVFRKSIDIFMQSAEIDYEKIRNRIERIEGIKNIHHMHAWLLDENTLHFEAHIMINNVFLSEFEKIYKEIENILRNEFNISHITIQPEVAACQEKTECGQ